MRFTEVSLTALGLASTSFAAPDNTNRYRVNAVKEAYRVSWNGYYDNVFPHDTLHPVANTYEDDRCAFPILSQWQ